MGIGVYRLGLLLSLPLTASATTLFFDPTFYLVPTSQASVQVSGQFYPSLLATNDFPGSNIVYTLRLQNLSTTQELNFAAPVPPATGWTSPPVSLQPWTNHLSVCVTDPWLVTNCSFAIAVRQVPIPPDPDPDPEPEPAPAVNVTDPPTTVWYYSSNILLSGTTSTNAVGIMTASNLASGMSYPFAAPGMESSFIWTSPPIELATGINTILITATNRAGATGAATVIVERLDVPTGAIDLWNVPTDCLFPWFFEYALEGSNTPTVVGTMWVSNAANGYVEFFPAPETLDGHWMTPPIYLEFGTNAIYVAGSNAVGEVIWQLANICRKEGTTRYVDASSTSPSQPFLSWAVAATSIQDAVNVSLSGDTVLVTNGLYNRGYLTNVIFHKRARVYSANSVSIRSVNGPAYTIIEGEGPMTVTSGIRGAYMEYGGELIGFTIRKGMTTRYGFPAFDNGGGVRGQYQFRISDCVVEDCEAHGFCGGINLGDHGGIVQRCVVRNNKARLEFGGIGANGLVDQCLIVSNRARNCGGVFARRLRNSVIIGNLATNDGGAVFASWVEHCTILSNYTWGSVGGALSSTVMNSIVYYNQGADLQDCVVSNSCSPLLDTTSGNITNEPLIAATATYEMPLQSNSPCIDAGLNGVADFDYAGVGRPLDGNSDSNAVSDIGAFEFIAGGVDSDGDSLLDRDEVDTWNTNPARRDTDHDRVQDGEEILAGTDPLDFKDYLRIYDMTPATDSSLDGIVLRWQTYPGRRYTLKSAARPDGNWSAVPTVDDVPGTGQVMSYTNPVTGPSLFNTISVRLAP